MGETRAGREQKAEAEGLAGGGVSMKKGTPGGCQERGTSVQVKTVPGRSWKPRASVGGPIN